MSEHVASGLGSKPNTCPTSSPAPCTARRCDRNARKMELRILLACRSVVLLEAPFHQFTGLGGLLAIQHLRRRVAGTC